MIPNISDNSMGLPPSSNSVNSVDSASLQSIEETLNPETQVSHKAVKSSRSTIEPITPKVNAVAQTISSNKKLHRKAFIPTPSRSNLQHRSLSCVSDSYGCNSSATMTATTKRQQPIHYGSSIRDRLLARKKKFYSTWHNKSAARCLPQIFSFKTTTYTFRPPGLEIETPDYWYRTSGSKRNLTGSNPFQFASATRNRSTVLNKTKPICNRHYLVSSKAATNSNKCSRYKSSKPQVSYRHEFQYGFTSLGRSRCNNSKANVDQFATIDGLTTKSEGLVNLRSQKKRVHHTHLPQQNQHLRNRYKSTIKQTTLKSKETSEWIDNNHHNEKHIASTRTKNIKSFTKLQNSCGQKHTKAFLSTKVLFNPSRSPKALYRPLARDIPSKRDSILLSSFHDSITGKLENTKVVINSANTETFILHNNIVLAENEAPTTAHQNPIVTSLTPSAVINRGNSPQKSPLLTTIMPLVDSPRLEWTYFPSATHGCRRIEKTDEDSLCEAHHQRQDLTDTSNANQATNSMNETVTDIPDLRLSKNFETVNHNGSVVNSESIYSPVCITRNNTVASHLFYKFGPESLQSIPEEVDTQESSSSSSSDLKHKMDLECVIPSSRILAPVFRLNSVSGLLQHLQHKENPDESALNRVCNDTTQPIEKTVEATNMILANNQMENLNSKHNNSFEEQKAMIEYPKCCMKKSSNKQDQNSRHHLGVIQWQGNTEFAQTNKMLKTPSQSLAVRLKCQYDHQVLSDYRPNCPPPSSATHPEVYKNSPILSPISKASVCSKNGFSSLSQSAFSRPSQIVDNRLNNCLYLLNSRQNTYYNHYRTPVYQNSKPPRNKTNYPSISPDSGMKGYLASSRSPPSSHKKRENVSSVVPVRQKCSVKTDSFDCQPLRTTSAQNTTLKLPVYTKSSRTEHRPAGLTFTKAEIRASPILQCVLVPCARSRSATTGKMTLGSRCRPHNVLVSRHRPNNGYFERKKTLKPTGTTNGRNNLKSYKPYNCNCDIISTGVAPITDIACQYCRLVCCYRRQYFDKGKLSQM